jgi:hypothetical protein
MTPQHIQISTAARNGIHANAIVSGPVFSDQLTARSTENITFWRSSKTETKRRVQASGFRVRSDAFATTNIFARLLEVRFAQLAARWKSETALLSSTEDIVLNDAYQRILAIGPPALPFIFAELKAEVDNPRYWHWALERIAGVDPTSPAGGNTKELRAAWLAWARENGFAV